MKLKVSNPILPLALLICLGNATAQQAGNVSTDLLRQQERELERLRTAPPPREETLIESLPDRQQPAASEADISFVLKKLVFGESSILPARELEAIAAEYVGKTISFAELQQVVGRINALYDARGFATARAVLPAQRISQGEVRIELVEGRIGKLKVEGNRYIGDSYITERLQLEPGELVDPTALENTLSRFNRLSQARLTAALQPGEGFGLTDIYLRMQEPKRNRLDLFMNDHGYRSTGRESAGLFFQHYGLAGMDDSLVLFLSGSEGTSAGSVSYDYPFNRYGGRVGIRAGKSRAKVINGPFRDIDSRSVSENANLSVSHPLWSNREWLVSGQLNHGQQRTTNTISGVLLNKNRVTTNQLELSSLYSTPGRSLYLTVNVQKARSEMQGTPYRESFTVTGGTWQFSQAWTPRLHTAFSGAWQYARRDGIPSSLVFQIGGPSTVRGYRQGELAGDGGAFGNLQANYQITEQVGVFAFYDRGVVDASFRQPEHLESAGIGTAWKFGDRVSGEIIVGKPLKNVRSEQERYQVNARLVFHLL